jgi:hypothetical protein
VVIRVLLVADALLVTVVGGIAAAFVERPAGWLIAGAAWLLGLVMFACVPLTDPYRHDERHFRDPS